ncbi:MAG: tetratricopeptide repeat protein [Clostridium sp.]|nr:tetratricopeptide repeat protein [Clostridium sp.]
MTGGGQREYGRRPDGRRPGGNGDNRGAGRRGSSADRRRRRRKRLIKAVIAWAVCALLAAAVAAGTFQLIGYVTTSKMRQFRDSGLDKMEAENYSGAIADFDLALEKAGKRTDFKVDVLSYRAEAEYRLRDYDAAVYSYGLLLELEPRMPEYRYLQSMCYSKLGNTDQAIESYEKGVSLEKKGESSPGRELALIAAGSACVDNNEYDKAMSFYNKAIEDGMVYGQIYNQMGLCQVAEADYEGALDSFNKGYEVLVTGHNLGSGARADQAAEALKEEPGTDLSLLKELTYNRAVTYEYLQQYDKALALFQEYTDAFGADEKAQHEMDFLRSR